MKFIPYIMGAMSGTTVLVCFASLQQGNFMAIVGMLPNMAYFLYWLKIIFKGYE